MRAGAGIARSIGHGHQARGGRAFTLVEVVVVLVILGILAGLVAPAVLRTSSRQAEAESRAVQQLLTIAAERDALSSEPLAIDYDDSAAELRIVVRRGADWSPDPLVEPVRFGAARLPEARSDGRLLPRSRWRVVFSQVQARPAIVLDLAAGRSAGAGTAWRVALTPDSPAAVRTAAGAGGSADRTIDLDAAGRGEKAW